MLSLGARPIDEDRFAYSFQGIGRLQADAATIAFWLVALLAIAGVVLGALRAAPVWLWLTPLLLYVSVIWISGDIRYRLPIEPFFVWAAAFALVAGYDRLRGRRPAPPPPPTPAPLR